jgi:hypothetical protein
LSIALPLRELLQDSDEDEAMKEITLRESKNGQEFSYKYVWALFIRALPAN